MITINQNSTDDDKLKSAIKKAGDLEDDVTTYCGLDTSSLELFRDLLDEDEEQRLVQFEGVFSSSLDPDVALQTGATGLLSLLPRKGILVPNNELELLQCDARYRLVDYVESPEVDDSGEDATKKEIFYLEEVDEEAEEQERMEAEQEAVLDETLASMGVDTSEDPEGEFMEDPETLPEGEEGVTSSEEQELPEGELSEDDELDDEEPIEE
jgi:hypothetical protein